MVRVAWVGWVGLLLIIGPAVRIVQAQAWPQWRGPNRDGVVTGFQTPARWPQALSLKWRVPIGSGYSSPIVLNAKIYLHARQGEQEIVTCLNQQTGRTLWSTSYAAPSGKSPQEVASEGEGPYATPVLFAGRLYTLGVTAILSCFEAATGRLLWRQNFSDQIKSRARFCGSAVSPLIEQGHLIIQVGDDRQGEVIALAPASGEIKWRIKGDAPGYASPIVATLAGVRQLLLLTDKALEALSIQSGELLWRLPFASNTSGCSENSITPIAAEGRVIITGKDRGIVALAVTKADGQWQPRTIWHNQKIAPHLSTPVLSGNYLYGLSHFNKGQFFALDTRTGQPVWISAGRQADNAALLATIDRLIILTAEGKLLIAAQSTDSFDLIAQYDLSESIVWAHPVLLGREILVRETATLALWQIP